MKVIQLSDIHLTDGYSSFLYGINPHLRLQEALKSINQYHSDADFIAITGDLADKASLKTYEIFKKISDESKLPIYPILGNHDKRDIFASCFPEFLSDGFVQYVIKKNDKVHIFLDTLVEDRSYGELCLSRMSWLKDRLEEYGDNLVYIYMHHHPIDSSMQEFDSVANFRSSEEFWGLLAKHTNVKHISFGHLHRIMHSTKHNISLHCTRGTTFQVSYQPRSEVEYLTNEENPTYAIIESMSDESVRVHHHEFMSEDKFYLGDC